MRWLLLLLPLSLIAESVQFTPPAGWRFADTQSLPPSVMVMVVGQGSAHYPPSINLGSEPFSGTLKEYLKIVKKINDSQKAEWKDLGALNTDAGEASLSQVQMQTEWGPVKMLHVILLKDETAYILTAAALKDDFPKHYNDFFTSLRSLHFN